MLAALFLSFAVIFVAELGDKSQLMAMTFALRYRWWVVLAGITAAVVGVILKLSLWFAFHILFREVTQIRHGWLALDLPVPLSLDPVAAVLALVAAYVLFRRHWSVAGTVGLTAALGFAVRMSGLA